MFLHLFVATIVSFSVMLPFLPKSSSVEMTRTDVEKLLSQNLRAQQRSITLRMACGVERMGRTDRYNGGCKNVEIFSKFANQFGSGVVSIETTETPPIDGLSVLFAPNDYTIIPNGEYANEIQISADCKLVTIRNKTLSTRYVHVGPRDKNAQRCLTFGFFSDAGIDFRSKPNDENSIDYILAYLLLISPTTDFDEAIKFAELVLSPNKISLTIKE